MDLKSDPIVLKFIVGDNTINSIIRFDVDGILIVLPSIIGDTPLGFDDASLDHIIRLRSIM